MAPPEQVRYRPPAVPRGVHLEEAVLDAGSAPAPSLAFSTVAGPPHLPAPSRRGRDHLEVDMDRTQRAVPVLLLVLAALIAVAPAIAQEPAVTAAPPEGAVVYRFTVDHWDEPLCAGAREWTFDVPAGQWVAFPIGWYAVDEATARANWESMRFELAADGRTLDVPVSEEWAVDVLDVQCPDRTITGVAVSPVVYLPPITAERRYEVSYIFDDDVNDGWYMFARGTTTTWTVRLRPED
jgi:hypothetical protein